MRFLGFVFIVAGFIVLVLGIGEGAHALAPMPWPDRTLEVLGACILLAGIGLTALAGRAITTGTATMFAAPQSAPNSAATVKFTTSKVFRVNLPSAAAVEGVTSGPDTGSTAILRAVMARLDDPAQAAQIQIQGGNPEQVKEQLRKILSLSAKSEPNAAAPAIDAQAQRMRELDDLHASGFVTDEQYQAIRAKLTISE